MKLVKVIFLLFFFNSFSQDIGDDLKPQTDQEFTELVNSLDKYNAENPIEKVYLHFDRDIATTGDDLWYTAYLTLGPYHTFSNASKVLYLDLINAKNEVIISQTQAIENGRSNGSISIPKEIPLGNYSLRAYTKWMTNYDPDFFFDKVITITGKQSDGSTSPSLNDKVNLRFFPEGGQLVENISCRVAFKAIGENGLGKEIKGHIVDATNEFVCNIVSTPEGFGLFRLHPETGKTYKAILDDGSIYELPKVLANGYSVSINNLDFETIKVRVSASDYFKNKPFYLVGTIRNQKFFDAKFQLNKDGFFDLEIPKNELPSGVLTITLFDENKRPRCERLVFVNNQQKFKVKVTSDTYDFNKRMPVSLHINITDENNAPVSTQLSVAITDAGYIEKDEYSRNILSYMLLESDIKGHINNPNYFFKDKTRKTLINLDLIMMTHGWRRYRWQDITNSLDQSRKNYFEQGVLVSGTAYGRNSRPLANTQIKMIGLNDTGFLAYPAITDESGHFEIFNVNFLDSIKVTFNGYNKRNKPIDIKVKLDRNEIVPVGKLYDYNIGNPKKEEIDTYMESNYDNSYYESIFDEVTELDEVIVTEKKVERPESPSVYGIVPDAVVYQDKSTPKSLSLLLSSIPGVFISGGIGSLDAGVTIRGAGTVTSGAEPLWVVDGTIIGSPDRVSGNHPLQYLSENDIERIEVLKGSSAASFGANGSNGVILIYTSRGNSLSNSPTSKSSFEYTLSHSGEKEFYNPNYDLPNSEQEKSDLRKTLFWKPMVQTDENGNAKVAFFNSDVAKRIQVVVDFLTPEGEPGYYINTFPTD